MIKISCRLSRFLTEWSFRAKCFPRQVPTHLVILFVPYEISQTIYFYFIMNANKRTSLTMEFFL